MSTDMTHIIEYFDEASQTWKAEFGKPSENPYYSEDEPKWITPYTNNLNPAYDMENIHNLTEDKKWFGKFGIKAYVYTVYALLADMRNRKGGPSPISSPRGLPLDISESTRMLASQNDELPNFGTTLKERKATGCSYVTLQELLTYNWRQEVSYDGKQQPLNEIETISRFLKVVDNMAQLRDGNPEKIRMVFWFDDPWS